MIALGASILAGLLAAPPGPAAGGWLTDWRVVGPYHVDDARRLGTSARPEALPGRRHRVSWRSAPSPTGRLEPGAWLSHRAGVLRAQTTFRIEGGGPLALHVAAEGAHRVWVDGAAVHRAPAGSPPEVVPLRLAAGVHRLDVVLEATGTLAVAVTDRAGAGPRACTQSALGQEACLAFAAPPTQAPKPLSPPAATSAPTPERPDQPASWRAKGEAALVRGARVAAIEAWGESLRLDPAQPALRRALRRLDPDGLRAPPELARPAFGPQPPGVAPSQVLTIDVHRRLWRDGRAIEHRRELLQIDDPARLREDPAGPDVIEAWLRPARGGPDLPWVGQRMALRPGDRLDVLRARRVPGAPGGGAIALVGQRAQVALEVDPQVPWQAAVDARLSAAVTGSTRTFRWAGEPRGGQALHYSRYPSVQAWRAALAGRLPARAPRGAEAVRAGAGHPTLVGPSTVPVAGWRTPTGFEPPALAALVAEGARVLNLGTGAWIEPEITPLRWVETGSVTQQGEGVVVALRREGGPAPELTALWPGAEPIDAETVAVQSPPVIHGPAPLRPWTRWRVTALALGRPFTIETRWTTNRPPPDRQLSGRFGSYTRRAHRLADGWAVTRRYQRIGGTLSAAERAGFLAFCAQVEAAEWEGPR